MRGTVFDTDSLSLVCRFIPAHAGNSGSAPNSRVPVTVHPRACGEQRREALVNPRAVGSSPRMRGTVLQGFVDLHFDRFIPAHAGNRSFASLSSFLSPVHPRACGEQVQVFLPNASYAGSSPRMRGTDLRRQPEVVRQRFIPAHAGNSWQRQPILRLTSVHPRACGEQSRIPLLKPSPFGSSPRMRGTDCMATGPFPSKRFIPAHAGNRSGAGTSFILPSVHPRACGEQFDFREFYHRPNGSSPRMRGTGEIATVQHRANRFIPAHAGNSCSP